MSLQFILGPPGSGKTTFCLNEIEAQLSQERPLYYLVPEQFSLQSERLILTGRAAVTQVQVLSFNRLAYRLFSLLGGPTGQVMDELGKTMLLRKVLLEVAGDLKYYRRTVDKHGFVDSLASTITELNHYRISSDDLRLRSENMGVALGAKLQDLALITARYRAAVKDNYLLADDMLDLLVQRLACANQQIPALWRAYIWADGFSGFTPQERLVLLNLMKHGAAVKITLTTRDKKTRDPMFTTPRETEKMLSKLATDAHIPVLPPIYLNENHRHALNPGLAFFTQNFSMRVKTNAVSPPKSGIEVLSAPDRYAAVYAAAHRILTWVNRGYDFKDIAIVCTDRGHYEKTLQTAFDRLGIPLFIDTETDILSHPLTELIRSALAIWAHNWKYEAVFRFLKTRLTGLSVDTIDILENFALAHGINGYRWRYPFVVPEAEEGRLHLLAALEAFGTSQAKDTIKGFSHKVFNMLYALKVPKALENWYDAHMAGGDPATARIHKQIWPKICQVFDKLVEILGEEKVSLESFSSVLDAGLNQVGLGRIPPTANQVILGDMGRSRYPEIKAMLVLGANDGVLPPIPTSPGLFSEDERRMLKNTDIELAPDNLARINEQYYALYCVLCQPKEKLSFIYAEGEPGGAILRPSHVLKRVQTLFPSQRVIKAPILKEYDSTPTTHTDVPVLESAKDIYGPTIITAASRLEAFARCPFQYFVNYILQARPRRYFQVLPTDLGNLYHDVLARFTNKVAAGDIDVNTLDRLSINAIANEMVMDFSPETAAFHASARNQHVLAKASGICAASIWALTEHIKRGKFAPIGAEIAFNQAHGMPLEDGRKLALTGRIDRVDLMNDETGEEYLRIIDYKSGQARFDISQIEQGLQLQLMLYMNALTKTTNGVAQKHPAGAFYFPIDDPIIDADIELGDLALEAALLKRFRLSGVTIEGAKILEGMDASLSPGTDSSVIPVKINKDGSMSKTGRPLVLSTDDFTRLGQAAEDKAKELAHRMIRGDIEPNPCPKGINAPCRYCAYGAICKRM